MGFVVGIVSTIATFFATSGFFAQLAGAIILGAISNRLRARAMKQSEAVRELEQPNSLVPYRFVVGHTRTYGSPAPWRSKGDKLFGCLILNSRPSAGPFTVFLDKREVEFTGDPYDFSGPGATATNDPFVGNLKYWIGRGDQLGPPAEMLTGGAADFFLSTDAWRGRTVIWIEADCGPREDRETRWPRLPPEVEVEGDWSVSWDPSDPGQDPDDPSTWTFSRNHGRIILDIMRTNPIRQYPFGSLLLETFLEDIAVSGEVVSLASGGSEARYNLDGVLIFSNAELEELVMPLIQSGAADAIRVGGRFGLSPGKWYAPVGELTDLLQGGPVEYVRWGKGSDLPTTVRTTYISKSRGYEDAELPPYEIPGALEADGGIEKIMELNLPFCTSPTQGQRVTKIEGLKRRRQRRTSGEAPPMAFNWLTGHSITFNPPAPFDGMGGVYEIQGVHPAAYPVGEDGGVALRNPIVLLETGSYIYSWTTEEEVEVNEYDFDPGLSPVAPPGPISATIDSTNIGGGVTVPRVRFEFDPSPSASVRTYIWEYRVEGGQFREGGIIQGGVRDAEGDVFGFVQLADIDDVIDIRVWAASRDDRSQFVEITGVIAGTLFSFDSASSFGFGSSVLEGRTPPSSSFDGFHIYRTSGPSFTSPTQIGGLWVLNPDEDFSFVIGDATRTNLLVNGDMSSATGWTIPTDLSISGGVATKVAGAASRHLSQTPSGPDYIAGAVLRCGYTALTLTAGNMRFRAVGGVNVDGTGTVLTAAGTARGSLTLPASPGAIGLFGNTACAGTFDDAWAFVETPTCLPQGTFYFWIFPVFNGSEMGQGLNNQATVR